MLFFLLIAGLAFVSADRCGSVPPSLWCSSKNLSTECGFDKLCDRYRSSTNNKRINVTVLIEALCPDCQRYIVEELYPNVYKNFANFINLELVPYGNAHFINGTIQCQHGPEECKINKFESCLIDAMKAQDQYVPFIYCLENNLQYKVPFETASEKCFKKQSISTDIQMLVQSCLVSRLGELLQKKAGERTDGVWPDKHRHVPWVVINDISIESEQMMMDHLSYLICTWYTGDKEIPYCQKEEKKKLKMWSLNV